MKSKVEFEFYAKRKENKVSYLAAIFIGALAGTISGLLGVGGGIVLIPLLVYILKLEFKHAVVASLVIIVPTAVSSVLGHVRSGSLSGWTLASWLLIATIIFGAVFGSQLGAYFCNKWDIILLKRIFACLLLITGVKMLLSTFTK